METVTQQNLFEANQEVNSNDSGLKHGQFKVYFNTLDNTPVEHVINPPTQEELAEGWQLVVPHKGKNSTIHHFSVYLSQLPPYLWKSLQKTWDDNSEQYKTIEDGIYQYSVKMSKHDDQIQQLYELVIKHYPNKSEVSKVYDYLEKQRVKGWLMLRAKNIITA